MPRNVMGFADPLVQRFSWPEERPYTEADADAFFEEQEAARQRGEEVNVAIVSATDEELVFGGASLYDIRLASGIAAIGYWLGPDARGKGIASRSVSLLARWAFECLGIERLELMCGPDNTASQRVAERCGFVREGVLRSHLPFKGERRDTVIFSLLRTDGAP